MNTGTFREIVDNYTASPSRESAILLYLARTLFNTEKSHETYASTREDVNWSDLAVASHNHAVLPLIYKQLQSFGSTVVPRHILDYMKVHYCSTALLNFYLAQELLQLLDLFRSNEISVLPYKGPVLAVSAYGSLSLRQFLDLDILVDPRDYDRAKEVLLAEGFRLQADYGWESHFISSNGGYCLDLHKGLTPRMFPYPITFSNLWQRRQNIALCNDQIPGLSLEDSLLILCIQVAKDSWAKQTKLAKLCDIGQMLHTHSALNWELLLTEAGRIGARGTLSFAFALVYDVLGIALPITVSSRIRPNRSIAALAAQARNELLIQLSAQASNPPQLVTITAQARFHSQLRERFRDRLPYRLEPLRRIVERLFIPNARDHSFFPLPAACHCFYWLIRPFRLACDYLLTPFMRQHWLSNRTTLQRGGTEQHQPIVPCPDQSLPSSRSG